MNQLLNIHKMKLNLGCGRDHKEGYINCDISKLVNPDMIVDLEKKLPFENNSVNEIIIEHTLEHINNFIPLIHEFHRICKKDTIIKIKVPFYLAYRQFTDPTHVRFFSPFTFNYFNESEYSHEVGVEGRNMFNIQKKIIYGVGKISILNYLFNPLINISHKFYCQFIASLLPASEISFNLTVIK